MLGLSPLQFPSPVDSGGAQLLYYYCVCCVTAVELVPELWIQIVLFPQVGVDYAMWKMDCLRCLRWMCADAAAVVFDVWSNAVLCYDV